MVIRLACLFGIIPVLLIGCASVPHVEPSAELVSNPQGTTAPDTAVSEKIHDPLSVKPCPRTERNLTVAWGAKHYLCTHENRREALQKINDGEVVAYQYPIKPLAKPQAAKENTFILPADAPDSVKPQEKIQLASFTTAAFTSVEPSQRQESKPDIHKSSASGFLEIRKCWVSKGLKRYWV